jgi:DNA-binding transcriptional MerR regulator
MIKKAIAKKLKTKEICKLYDISRSTLFRWETEGLITGVERDWRGWRLYHDKNLKEIEKIIRQK